MRDPFETFRSDVDFMWRTAMHSWASLMVTSAKLDRESLAMLTLQMYHYVKLTVPVFREALARLDPEPQHDRMRGLLEYFIADEEGHDRVALRDLERLGYDADRCRATTPLPTTLNLQGANKLAIEQYGPYFLLGESYATETVGATISQAIHDAYQQHAELRDCVAFYRVHGEADVEHAARSEEILRHYLPERRRPIVLGCLTAWKNLMNLGTELQSYRLYPSEFQLPSRG